MENKVEALNTYIKSNVGPILVDFIYSNTFPDSVVLPANIDKSELNGYYDNTEFVCPDWFNKLKNHDLNILVIDGIDSISKDEQTKFIEILKYKKVSTFELPKNTVIIVTAKEINANKINEEIYSLVVHIEG